MSGRQEGRQAGAQQVGMLAEGYESQHAMKQTGSKQPAGQTNQTTSQANFMTEIITRTSRTLFNSVSLRTVLFFSITYYPKLLPWGKLVYLNRPVGD